MRRQPGILEPPLDHEAKGDIGRDIKGGVEGGIRTKIFTIQSHVNLLENQIDYHGFPDERLRVTGAGKTKSTIIPAV
jgi:hypothetical protein